MTFLGIFAGLACSGGDEGVPGDNASGSTVGVATGGLAAGGLATGGVVAGSGGGPGAGGTASGTGGAVGAGGATQTGGAGGTGGGQPSGGLPGSGGLATTGGAPSAGGAAAGGTNSGGQGGTVIEGSLTLSGLTIEMNPLMSLGAYVSWTTNEATTSEVQFGEEGFTHRIVDETLTTEHRVHVVGMNADTLYNIKVISTNESGSISDEGSHTTGGLPADLKEAELLSYDPEKSIGGWTLTNFQSGVGEVVGSDAPGIMVILDEQAKPVWYYVHGSQNESRGDLSTEWVAASQSVLIGAAIGADPTEVNMEGEQIWTGLSGSGLDHHVSKLSNGNYLVIRSGSTAQEIDSNNQVVWEWRLGDHFDIPQGNDWCHLNSLSLDEASDALYFNCRWQGTFKVDRPSGDIIWFLGADNDGVDQGDFSFGPGAHPDPQVNDSHDPEFDFQGGVIYFDNQGYTNRTPNTASFHSRVIEYELNEADHTATVVWEFPGDFAVADSWYTDTWQSAFWGDADILENDNVLVTAPMRGTGTQTRIFEVTRAGEVVWAMRWPDNNGSYRADRFPALAERIQ